MNASFIINYPTSLDKGGETHQSSEMKSGSQPYLDSSLDDLMGGTGMQKKNPLAGRLRPKSLHTSASAPTLKISVSQTNLFQQFSNTSHSNSGSQTQWASFYTEAKTT